MLTITLLLPIVIWIVLQYPRKRRNIHKLLKKWMIIRSFVKFRKEEKFNFMADELKVCLVFLHIDVALKAVEPHFD
jgi:hypothetical protein